MKLTGWSWQELREAPAAVCDWFIQFARAEANVQKTLQDRASKDAK